ncbi:MAG TPA: Gfo/Idh/MocA family oxidoreductase [Terriglobales bacterium]|nr:Gfo/Idh/MocA family oxidoreductase [Terriglobales bacterium]
MNPPRLRLALLGCGEITRTQHLPAALVHPEIEVVALVDADEPRARSLARDFQISCRSAGDCKSVLPDCDAVINALPNALHAAATLELLHAGKHVLCEKPLATTSADARACSELAARRDLVLAVGMNRRFDSTQGLLHCVLRGRQLGDLVSYDWQYGGEFEWHSASGFYFNRSLAGGGVLMDFGVHLLDALVNWFGPVTTMDYQDDDWGSGVEANCILHLQHQGKYGPIAGRVQMSRTVTLPNRLLVRGSAADAEVRVGVPDAMFLYREIGGEKMVETIRLAQEPGKSSFHKQLDNFVESIRGHQSPVIDGEQAVQVLELIEWCYGHRQRIPEPWSEIAPAMSSAGA